MTTPAHVGTKTAEDLEALITQCRNWGRWGPDDELGTLNLITPERLRAGAATIEHGRSVSLSIPVGVDGPQTGRLGRYNPQHLMLRSGLDGESPQIHLSYADDAVILPLQAGTQWDALSHVFHGGKMWNGHSEQLVTTAGAQRNSIAVPASHFAGRAVLADLAAYFGVPCLEQDHVITPGDLDGACAAQGSEVQSGDILIVRTGLLPKSRADGWSGFASGPQPGMGLDTAPWLRDHEVAAIALDTGCAEVRPAETPSDIYMPWHRVVLTNMGMHIGEMWDLEELSETCAELGRYVFFLSAPGLVVTGGVGTPVNPIAFF